MSYLNFKSDYDCFPKTKIKEHKAFHGYDEIYHELNKILYLIFDYPHKHYTFKHFEI